MGPFSMGRLSVNLLRVLWIIIALWYELGIFASLARGCRWPDSDFMSSSTAPVTKLSPYHVLIVADPQILNHRSYPGRSPFLTYISQLVVDLNLRKNWWAAMFKRPDAVVFLGDMMDGGRYDMQDEEYHEYYSRFRSIFKHPRSMAQYYIPGNHDTGLGQSSWFSPQAKSRYVKHFGKLNSDVQVANHTLVFLDAPGLVDEDYRRAGKNMAYHGWTPVEGGPIEFIKQFAEGRREEPVVLFTHIPLYRPDGANCGPLREKGHIRPGVGEGYQNTLGKETSRELLQALHPSVIFSGDDHDYCEYTHGPRYSRSLQVREVTVKSLSMAMNVRKPGFQLLSLAPVELRGESHTTHADVLCLLPDQLGIYLNIYVPLLVISLLVVLFSNITECPRFHPNAPHNNIGISRTPHLRTPGIRVRQEFGEDEQNGFGVVVSQLLPTPASALKGKSSSSPSWTFNMLGRRRRITLNAGQFFGSFMNLLKYCFGDERSLGRRKRRGFWGGFLRDVRDVAVYPLGIFLMITLFMQ